MDKPWGLEKKSTEFWEEMYWRVVAQFKNQFGHRFLDLEELNQRQAGMLMERDLTIRELKNQVEDLLNDKPNNYESMKSSLHETYQLIIKNLKERYNMEKNTAEVLPFARLGNSSEPPVDNDWLSKLESGTRFLARLKISNGVVLDDCVVASDPKAMDYVFLGINLNSRDGGFRWVDPKKFSQAYDFCMTLEIIENKNGNSDQVQTGGMDSDAKPEVISGVHERE